MANRKPPTTIEEYKHWALETLGVDYDSDVTATEFRVWRTFVWNAATKHGFFSGIQAFLRDSQEVYAQRKNAVLFVTEEVPSVVLLQKPYASMIKKSFRYNVVNNGAFPSPPSNEQTKFAEWLTPDSWFSRIDDVVRTMIICKYVDGPRFLAERLYDYAGSLGLRKRYKSQQKDDGYYAYHFYVSFPVNMLSSARKPVVVDTEVEIQLTTQLQEVIREITHAHYEDLRIHKESDPDAWKWDLESSRFRAGYLSHTLHLLEAMIVEIRNANPKPPED